MDSTLKTQLADWFCRALLLISFPYLVCLPASWWVARNFCFWGTPPTPDQFEFWCRLFRVAVSFTCFLVPWFGLVGGWIAHGVVSDGLAAKHRSARVTPISH